MIREYEILKRLGQEVLNVTIRRDFDKQSCMAISIFPNGLNCSYIARKDVTSAQILDELHRVYVLLQEPHWRDYVAHNIASGCLFDTL